MVEVGDYVDVEGSPAGHVDPQGPRQQVGHGQVDQATYEAQGIAQHLVFSSALSIQIESCC